MSTKVCIQCGLEKPRTEFHKATKRLDSRYHNVPEEKHGEVYGDTHNSRCKECRKEFRKKHDTPEKRRNQVIKRMYGITEHEYNDMVKLQQGRCAICKQECDKLFIDHNHTTGKVRGLLCLNCNTGIGMFKDNISYMKSAIDYVGI